MEDNDLIKKIEQVDKLLKLKDKAEVLKLELLTFTENKREQLLTTADDIQLGDDLREILSELESNFSEIFERINTKVEDKLGVFIS